MKIVNPNNTEHDIVLIPRYNPIDELSLQLYNEATQVSENVNYNNYSISDGFLTINFDYTFADNSKYQFKLYQNENIIFRGKILATTQNTQQFKSTIGAFYYE